MITLYIVEVNSDEQTRTHLSEEDTRKYLEVLVSSFLKVWTQGPIPKVKVVRAGRINSGLVKPLDGVSLS